MRNSLIALFLVIAILIGAITGYVIGTAQTETVTSYSTITSFVPSNCPSLLTSSNSGFAALFAGNSSPATLCLQFYYYDSAASLTLNLSRDLSIHAVQYIQNGSVGNPKAFSGAANFTVTPSQNQVVLGGPTGENEGTITIFVLTANKGASGTYELDFLPSSGLTTWMIGTQEPENCGYYAELVAGNGQPNYVQPTGCITYSMTSVSGSVSSTSNSSSNYNTLPGIPYQLLSGNVYFRIVGASNSTQ
jgi:hypothetical protein